MIPLLLSIAIAMVGGILVTAAGFRDVERKRVASCILAGICPDCGRPTLSDCSIARRQWPIGYWCVPGTECSSCNVRRRLPVRVRDHRIEQACAAAKAIEQRTTFKRVK
jgi:hypothetical protein